MTDEDCVFCKIAARKIPAHIVWEGAEHLAFLSIFPNTDGFTVVMTKDHLGSDVFSLSEEQYHALLTSAFEVAPLLQLAFKDVSRVALVAEGMGVDHAHLKLIPLHGLADGEWKANAAKVKTFYEKYPGFICTNDSRKAEEAELKRIAEKIRAVQIPVHEAQTPLPTDDKIAEFIDPMADDSE